MSVFKNECVRQENIFIKQKAKQEAKYDIAHKLTKRTSKNALDSVSPKIPGSSKRLWQSEGQMKSLLVSLRSDGGETIMEISGEHEAAMSSIELQRGFLEIVLKKVDALLLACRRVLTSHDIGKRPAHEGKTYEIAE